MTRVADFMTRMHRPLKAKRFLVALAAVVLTAGSVAAAKRSSSKNTCLVKVHAVERDGTTSSRRRYRKARFSADETSRLELRAYCSAETPASALTLNVFLPNGDLYEALEPVAVERSPSRGRRRWHHVASAELPVAGTLVTQYQLFGKWSARICRSDGTSEGCGRVTRFTLEE
jgi:hypothetical protein